MLAQDCFRQKVVYLKEGKGLQLRLDTLTAGAMDKEGGLLVPHNSSTRVRPPGKYQVPGYQNRELVYQKCYQIRWNPLFCWAVEGLCVALCVI